MKNILTVSLIAAFVLTFASAYAGVLDNGVTDFTGRSYDNHEIGLVKDEMAVIEGSAAGGARIDKELWNGVTDFSGRTYDRFEIAVPGEKMDVLESSAAGGARMDKKLANGVTDFSGRSYDTHEIGL